MRPFVRIRSRIRPAVATETRDELDRLSTLPSSWTRQPLERLEAMLMQQLLLYGTTNDPARLPRLLALYRHATHVLPVLKRYALLQEVAGAVMADPATARAFLPFILVDPSVGLASSAALDYATFLPPSDGDPLTGPKQLLGLWATVPDEQARVAILLALLMAGDRRVVALLESCWTDLTPAGQAKLAGAWPGFAYAPVVEFLAGRLAWWNDPEDEAVFAAVAGALLRIPQQARPAAVLEVERVFPAFAALEGIAVIERQRWSIPEFGRRIARMLLGATERKHELPVMREVLAAWGIRSQRKAAGGRVERKAA